MLKKILFIICFVGLGLFVSEMLTFDDKIVINTLTYQITTTTSFLLFLFFIIFFVAVLFFYIIFNLLSPNINRINKNKKKTENKFNEYLNLMVEGFIYKNIKNTTEARKILKKANRTYKETNLSKLLESQIFYIEGKYKNAEKSFKEIKDNNINLDLLAYKHYLKEAEKQNNINDIEKYAKYILNIESIDVDAIINLFKVYILKKQWIKADEILNKGLKVGVFNKHDNKNDILFLYTSIGKMFFDNQDYKQAKKYLRKVYSLDKDYIQAIILLIETYIALGKHSKAISIILKVWKYNTNSRLAELYFSLQKAKDKNSIDVAKKLYKINHKSFESNFILARAYYLNHIYFKARKYAKIADGINETKDLYELMINIEKEDNGSSAIIAALKNKMLNLKNPHWVCNICKREYYNWQPECNNCKNLDSLKFNE